MDSDKESNFIPTELFNKIIKVMPIVSVEAVIIIDDALLFLKRNNQPAQGEWWFPGGRVRKGESLKQALFREVREETGLEVTSYKLIGVYSRVFPERHDITIAYLCDCKGGKISLNSEHSKYALFRENPVGLHPYLIETTRDSKWEEKALNTP